MKENEDFAFECVRIDGLSLRFMPDSIRKNKDVIVEAVLQNPVSLKYAH